jgi:hypothetical protein
MFPIMFGFAAALAFDALAYATYGSAALTDYAWVNLVSWGLMGGGIVVYALNRPAPAWLKRLAGRARDLLQARMELSHPFTQAL